jgi:hypothetical protein
MCLFYEGSCPLKHWNKNPDEVDVRMDEENNVVPDSTNPLGDGAVDETGAND